MSSRSSSSDGRAPLPQKGQRLDEFEILDCLGQGGMGAVFSALDHNLNRRVAIKVLRTDDENHRQRFEREAELLRELDNRSCFIELYDCRDSEYGPLIVMEWIDGPTLESLLKSRRFTVAEGLELTAKILDALDAVHDTGIVHRDLKPANIMFRGGRMEPVIMDFGLARGLESSTLTKTHETLGTPHYMAPEQVSGDHKNIGPWTDLWAVGVMAYQICSNELPFQGRRFTELAAAIFNAPVPSIGSKIKNASAEMDAFFERALAKSREYRYADAEDMAEDIRLLLEGRRISASQSGYRVLKALGQGRGMLIAVLSVVILGAAISVPIVFAWQRRAQALRDWRSETRTALQSVRAGQERLIEDLYQVFADELLALASFPARENIRARKRLAAAETDIKNLERQIKRSQNFPELKTESVLPRRLREQINWSKTAIGLTQSEHEWRPKSKQSSANAESQSMRFLSQGCEEVRARNWSQASFCFTECASQSGAFQEFAVFATALCQLKAGGCERALKSLRGLQNSKRIPSRVRLLRRLIVERLTIEHLVNGRRQSYSQLLQLKQVFALEAQSKELWREWNQQLLRAFQETLKSRPQRAGRVFHQMEKIKARVPELILPELTAEALVSMASEASAQGRLGEALTRYQQARVRDANVRIPRNFQVRHLESYILLVVSDSKFSYEERAQRAFELVVAAGRAGFLTSSLNPEVLRRINGMGIIDAALRETPDDPIVRFFRAERALPFEKFADEDFAKAFFTNLFADFMFVINHQQCAEVFRAKAMTDYVLACVHASRFQAKLFPLKRKALRKLVFKSLKLKSPEPDKCYLALAYLEPDENDLMKLQYCGQSEKWSGLRRERTSNRTLSKDRPANKPLVPMTPDSERIHNSKLAVIRAKTYNQLKRYKRALSWANKGLALLPREELYYHKGEALLGLKRLGELRQLYTYVKSHKPNIEKRLRELLKSHKIGLKGGQ